MRLTLATKNGGTSNEFAAFLNQLGSIGRMRVCVMADQNFSNDENPILTIIQWNQMFLGTFSPRKTRAALAL